QNIHNPLYSEFILYENEIFMDTYDSVLDYESKIVKDTLTTIGENEVYHIIKYHIRIFKNAIYFNNKTILLNYHIWLFRLYHNKGVELDFFDVLNHILKANCVAHINSKLCMSLYELFYHITDNLDEIKKEAKRKTMHIEYEEQSSELANILIKGDQEKVFEICKNETTDIYQFIDFYSDIVTDAMKMIGFLWEIGKIDVSKEHIASQILNTVLNDILDSYPDNHKKNISIVIATSPNESHGLGINIASKVLNKLGYKVDIFDNNSNENNFIDSLKNIQPNIIILTATMQTNLIDIAQMIENIYKNRYLFEHLKIAVAGRAFDNIIHPKKLLKADMYISSLKEIKNL
ncbi:MAG: cobalamin-dependent protein, partial [Campylobacterales bacterium]|nr:cobalamin-dependent protein [Campylobacterales bacterium]